MLPSLSHVYTPVIKKTIFVILFFSVAPLTLLISFFTLNSVQTHAQQALPQQAVAGYQNVRVYAPSENTTSSVSAEVVLQDARPEILRKYMRLNKSPMLEYADYLVEISDKYDLDYRLLVAIAQKESGLCRVIPEGSHNCWGWGIHSQGSLGFDSYEQSIQTVARGLRKEYLDKGYVTIEEIMSKWVPHSPGGIWAEDVKVYMAEIG